MGTKKNKKKFGFLNVNFFVNSLPCTCFTYTHTEYVIEDHALSWWRFEWLLHVCCCFFLRHWTSKRARERWWWRCDVQKQQQRLYAIFQKQNWQIMLDFLLHYVTYISFQFQFILFPRMNFAFTGRQHLFLLYGKIHQK